MSVAQKSRNSANVNPKPNQKGKAIGNKTIGQAKSEEYIVDSSDDETEFKTVKVSQQGISTEAKKKINEKVAQKSKAILPDTPSKLQRQKASKTSGGSSGKANAINASKAYAAKQDSRAISISSAETDSSEDETPPPYLRTVNGAGTSTAPPRSNGDKPDGERSMAATTPTKDENPVQDSTSDDSDGNGDDQEAAKKGKQGKAEEEISSSDEVDASDVEDQDEEVSELPSEGILEPLYQAPAGFMSSVITASEDSTLQELMDSGKLQSKEIWHITVPECISLEDVQTISLKSISDGSAIINQQDSSYGLVPHPDQSQTTGLLVARTHDNCYVPIQIPISKTLHLQELVELPTHAKSQIASPVKQKQAQSQASSKSRNQQPAGLKMRSHAFGIAGAAFSSSDSDMDITTSHSSHYVPQANAPQGPADQQHPKKRKRTAISNPPTPSQETTSKAKKLKQQADIESSSTQTQAQLQSRINTIPNGHANSIPSKRKETKEERAKRKAEVKLREPFKIPRAQSPDTTKADPTKTMISPSPSKHAAPSMAAIMHNEDVAMADVDEIEIPTFESPMRSQVQDEESPEERLARKAAKKAKKEEKRRRKEEA